MGGLARICKAYGATTIIGNDGKRGDYVWDYVADKAVRREEMPPGSERHAASERAKHSSALVAELKAAAGPKRPLGEF